MLKLLNKITTLNKSKVHHQILSLHPPFASACHILACLLYVYVLSFIYIYIYIYIYKDKKKGRKKRKKKKKGRKRMILKEVSKVALTIFEFLLTRVFEK